MKSKRSVLFVLALILLVTFVGCEDKFDPGNAKAQFIKDFNKEIEEIEVTVGEEELLVATAVLKDNGDIEVAFETNEVDSIVDGANAVLTALKKLVKGDSAITIYHDLGEEEEDSESFKLKNADIEEIARYILAGMGAAEFAALAEGENVTVDYTADVYVEGGSFKLEGKLVFVPAQE